MENSSKFLIQVSNSSRFTALVHINYVITSLKEEGSNDGTMRAKQPNKDLQSVPHCFMRTAGGQQGDNRWLLLWAAPWWETKGTGGRTSYKAITINAELDCFLDDIEQ